MWWSKRDQPYTAVLPRMIGNGGPGTIYTSTSFHDAVAKHGKPNGPFDRDRELVYDEVERNNLVYKAVVRTDG